VLGEPCTSHYLSLALLLLHGCWTGGQGGRRGADEGKNNCLTKRLPFTDITECD